MAENVNNKDSLIRSLAGEGDMVEYLGVEGLERLCSVVKDALECATDGDIDALFD